MSKLTGLHSIFRKNSIYGANIGFHTVTFARSLGSWRCIKPRTTDLMIIEGHLISQSSVHGCDVEVCCPAFLARKPVTVAGLGWQWTHLTRIVARIDGSVCLSDMSTILKCLKQFWTEGPTHNNCIKKLQASRCSVAGDIDANPSAPNHKYSEYANPVLVQICRWLGTHSLLMKAFTSSKCNV